MRLHFSHYLNVVQIFVAVLQYAMGVIMIIETARLKLISLDKEQFKLFINSVEQLEEMLGLRKSNQKLDDSTKQAMELLYNQGMENEPDYIWYTNWQIILKSENKSIGSTGFMGRANHEGQVEIGYGINEPYRCFGYATEAVKALCQWALENNKVEAVIAEAEKWNRASHKVLLKCKMRKYKETKNRYFWILDNRGSNG